MWLTDSCWHGSAPWNAAIVGQGLCCGNLGTLPSPRLHLRPCEDRESVIPPCSARQGPAHRHLFLAEDRNWPYAIMHFDHSKPRAPVTLEDFEGRPSVASLYFCLDHTRCRTLGADHFILLDQNPSDGAHEAAWDAATPAWREESNRWRGRRRSPSRAPQREGLRLVVVVTFSRILVGPAGLYQGFPQSEAAGQILRVSSHGRTSLVRSSPPTSVPHKHRPQRFDRRWNAPCASTRPLRGRL